LEFKDFFSKHAAEYARYRPGYPPELFDYLNSITDNHHRAWDSAAGNGQAALELAPFFNEIIATDASEKQIINAIQHPKIKYRVAPSESSGIEPNSVNLITVATAIHWFQLEKFYAEVKRIMASGGILAVWNYGEANVNNAVDSIFHKYLYEIVGSYAAPEFWRGINMETEIDFPFQKIAVPGFKITYNWDLREYLNFIMTWSPTQGYIMANNSNPLEIIQDELKTVWGDENEKKLITWKLKLKAGRIK
jgi:SAM-dependent methyltransferase